MDADEFQRFYERSAPGLRSYLRLACRDPALADDLLQEGFLRLLRADPPALEEAQLRAYLYRSARSALADHFRRAGRQRGVEQGAAAAANNCHLPSDLPLDMARVLGRLKPRDRDLLWLAYVEGFSHREIAPVIAVSEKSVRVLLLRARERMARLLTDQGIGPGEA